MTGANDAVTQHRTDALVDTGSGSRRTGRTTINRAECWLQLSFAMLSCLGGLVLASGPGTEMIPVIAIFFAVFGFVFVDRLKFFSLPPIGAYIAMGAAAVYCVSDFWELHTNGSQQMVAVAMLLVLVQAILMLQRKTPRIFEQLGVFCLLQLVVGAVFNDAITFGLLLIPIGFFGAWALSLMSSVAASEGIETRVIETSAIGDRSSKRPSRPPVAAGQPTINGDDSWTDRLRRHWMFRPIGEASPTLLPIASWSRESIFSLAAATGRLQRFAIIALTPGVLVVTVIFFYALPRTTDAARLSSRGSALVGFDDQVRLEQFGQMLESSLTALRIKLTNRKTGEPYSAPGGMYLRGRVLEQYEADFGRTNPSAVWTAIASGPISGNQELPMEYIPSRVRDRSLFETVDVEITCNAMRQRSLFAIAPYHRAGSSTGVVHAVDRWTLSRKDDGMMSYPSIEYQFGTNAFRGGVQSSLLTRVSARGRMISGTLQNGRSADGYIVTEYLRDGSIPEWNDRSATSRSRRYRNNSYLGQLTRFDASSMPTINQLARDIVASIPPERRTVVTIAQAMERHLAIAGGYEYTLNLNAESQEGVDPIEQFVARDRRGHCQYFASALAMMLRSVNIPCRLVVGYHTEEFNDLGEYFVARQSHAHAWVEALVDSDQLDPGQQVYGQTPSNQYWLRLDPTPGEARNANAAAGGVDQVMNLAENLWEKYVVGMDSKRQDRVRVGSPDTSPVSAMANWIQQRISEIRSGNLRGGALAGPELFSWRGAIWGVLLAIALLGLVRLPLTRWFRWQFSRKRILAPDKPGISFYADTLAELSRVGLVRQQQQTPTEFANETAALCQQHQVDKVAACVQILTREFCRQRYGVIGNATACTDDHRDDDPEAVASQVIGQTLKQLQRRMDDMVANGISFRSSVES
ncbi:MAG: DUF3488 domain-containing protein [Pirellulaceae bacterium]|nr:DUF3488 domain-containing protein [Pirellulaceae bacterium]